MNLILKYLIFFSLILSLEANANKIAIFVNGNQDCCAVNMHKTQNALRQMGFSIYNSPWNSLSLISGDTSENQSPKVTVGATRNFINEMNQYLSTLPKGSDVYLFGHSFGGDSLLRFITSYRPYRNVKIKLLAVLDPVETGGFRSNTNYRSTVPSSVEYFYNRWQENTPWPTNITKSGHIPCKAGQCDQRNQNIARHSDGKPKKRKCRHDEICPGKKIVWQGIKSYIYPGDAQIRLHHSYVPTDPYIETQLINVVKDISKGSRYVLDANGGRKSPYMNKNLQVNDNLLFRLEKHGKFFRILPKVKKVALDANGGRKSPYFNSNLNINDNLLFKLEKYGKFYMIIPKVKRVALDANGGNVPYFHSQPNPNNDNHLWYFSKEGNYYRVYSKIRK